jgi:hypothetical protein
MEQSQSTIKIGYSGVKNKPYIVLEDIYLPLSNGDMMFVYRGYTFDNGSIPKWGKWLYDTFKWEFFNYRYTAFLVHDFLYNYRGYFTSPDFKLTPIERHFADDEMVHYMMTHNDTVKKIKIYFRFVKAFGGWFFGKI